MKALTWQGKRSVSYTEVPDAGSRTPKMRWCASPRPPSAVRISTSTSCLDLTCIPVMYWAMKPWESSRK